MELWRHWGLDSTEWAECVQAAEELAELSPGEHTPTAHEIAAQLAVAKAAEEWMPSEASDARRVDVK